MIEISFGKLVLLALIALIVLGPEKLPGVARTAGALLRRVRSGWDSVRSEVERELQIEEIKREAREAAARAEAAQAQLDATVREVREFGARDIRDDPAQLMKPGETPDDAPARIAATDEEPAVPESSSDEVQAMPEPSSKERPHGDA